MLDNKRITIIADTVVDGAKIAAHGAVININNMGMELTSRHIDKDACKTYRDMVRADQAEFEDAAYEIQELLSSMAIADQPVIEE